MNLKVYIISAVTTLFLSIGCASATTQSAEVIEERLPNIDSAFIASYDFADPNTAIYDPKGILNSFYTLLDSIPTKGEVVSIVHFGDSHIQGGYITEAIMRRFARDYGSAGRGFISAHKLSGKNEPRDYSLTATRTPQHSSTIAKWQGEGLNAGVNGIAIRSLPNTTYGVKLFELPEDTIRYRFNRVVVYHDSLAPIMAITDTSLFDGALSTNSFNSFTTEFNLKKMTDSVAISTHSGGKYSSGAIYGVSLESGEPGIIYHSLGVNGSCFIHWSKHPQIAQQSASLDPRLIIISLGSNEAAGSNFIENIFINQVDGFVQQLKAANPDIPILLTVPAEAMRRRRGNQTPNANYAKVNNALKEYAEREGVAIYSLFEATSGSNSARIWREHKLLRNDGIHYTIEGYTLQGVLIYNALNYGHRNCELSTETAH